MTSRASRIRSWLASQPGSFTSRDVLNAVEPRGDINTVSSTLDSLVKSGHALRKPEGGVKRFRISAAGVKAANDERKKTPAKAPKQSRESTAQAPAPADKPAKATKPPSAEAAIARNVSGKTRTSTQAVFIAPKRIPGTGALCSLSGIPIGNQVARERIADHIAEFERRGGKIEHLGTTKVFHDTFSDNDE